MADTPSSDTLQTPVLLLIFNRPETTMQVFQAIRNAKPAVFFVAADGPRKTYVDDPLKCETARNIANLVDWECDLKVLFQKENLGCGKGPVAGISWFFQHVEEGIILEDDCLPSPEFFFFCSELLARYRFDKRVMEIGVVNLIEDMCRDDKYSYYFSEHNHTWGWATWKRAWDLYDYSISAYQDKNVKEFLKNCFNSPLEYTYFKRYFDEAFCHHDEITWWDYQWEFARRINLGLSIVSKVNLIRNLGIGAHGTHTLDPNGIGSDLKVSRMSFPLKHPEFISASKHRDYYYFQKTFTTLPSRIKFKAKRIMENFINPKFSELYSS